RAWLARCSEGTCWDRHGIPAQSPRSALQKANEKPPQPRPLVPSHARCRSSPTAERQTAQGVNAARAQDTSSLDPFVSLILDRKIILGRIVSNWKIYLGVRPKVMRIAVLKEHFAGRSGTCRKVCLR